jgi:hypothetical protein
MAVPLPAFPPSAPRIAAASDAALRFRFSTQGILTARKPSGKGKIDSIKKIHKSA